MTAGTNTATTTSGPPPQVLQAYQGLTGAATNVAEQPLSQYGGPMVAGFTPAQQQAFGTIGNSQGIGTPYINSAAQEFGAATAPLYNTVGNYESPYTSAVTSSLGNLFNQQNAQQLEQVAGNATLANAYGGDREAVAQALTAQQQGLAEAPTMANTLQQGYQTALGANEAQDWLSSQAGFGVAGLGTQAQNQALTGASAELQAGGLEQQLAQENLNIPYEQFVQQQAYPYQQLGFLAPIVEGTGSLSGGTGSTTTPGQSALSQLTGLGLTGLGAYGLYNNLSGASNAVGSIGTDAVDAYNGLAKQGGRIHRAGGGGLSLPIVPGMGNSVPEINLSYIPQGAPGGISTKSGLSPFQPDVTQTQSSGGGGLGDLLSLAGLAAKFIKSGGRIHFDGGGSIGMGSAPAPQATNGQLPTVPRLSLDYISAPGPAVKGSGPPKAPQMPASAANQGFGTQNGTQFLQGAEQLKKSGLLSGDKRGGAIRLQDGGTADIAAATGVMGGSPNAQGYYQQLMTMPTEKLQELASAVPPTSPQGQYIQRALKSKQMGMGQTAPVSPSYAGIGALGASASGATAAPPASGGTAQVAMSQPVPGASLATGGDTTPGYVTESELDPHPIVDHSGDTVKVRYPSEGTVLDLGLPTLKRSGYAAGGAAGLYPEASFSSGQWTTKPGATSAPAGPADNAPLLGTSSGESGGPGATPFVTSLPTGNGVALPQLSNSLYAPPNAVPGEGLGNWDVPLPQQGATGANTIASEPQMAGVISALSPGASIPTWAGGAGSNGAPSSPASDSFMNGIPLSYGNFYHRGGRAHFDDGGDVAAPNPGDASPSEIFNGPLVQWYESGLTQDSPSPDAVPAPAEPSSFTSRPHGADWTGSAGSSAETPWEGSHESLKARDAAGPDAGVGVMGMGAAPAMRGAVATASAAPPTAAPPAAGMGASPPPTTPAATPAAPPAARSSEPASAMPPIAAQPPASSSGAVGGPVSPDLAKAAGFDPTQTALANFLWKGEGAKANTLYGGGTFSDMRQHPADAGWQGGVGPDGKPTHAAGIPQLEPGTWHQAAALAGVNDFSAPSQVKAGLSWAEKRYNDVTGGNLVDDFKAGKTDQIRQALSSEWPSLAGSNTAAPRNTRLSLLPAAAGVPDTAQATEPGMGRRMGMMTQGQGFGPSDYPDSARRGFSLSNNWMPLMVAGLSALGSRSPNAVAEGFRAASPYFQGQERAEASENRTQMMGQMNAERSANTEGRLNIQAQRVADQATAADRLYQQRNADLEWKMAHGTAELADRQAAAQSKAEATAANLQLAGIKVQLGEYNPPVYGPGDDPDHPGQKTNGLWYSLKFPSPNEPNGGAKFFPNVGTAKPATGANAVLQEMVAKGEATDLADADQKRAAYQKDPTGFQHSAEYTRLVQAEEKTLQGNVGNIGKSPTEISAMAQKNVQTMLGETSATAPKITTPGTAPKSQSPQKAAAPPSWAIGKAAAMPNGQIIYSDGKGWYDANHTPVQ